MNARRGFALIVAIWALAALAGIATVFSLTVRREAVLARNAVDLAEARHIADAAAHFAILALVDPPSRGRLRIDGTPFALRLDEIEAEITVTEEGGKVDLNEAPAPLLANLLLAAGAPRAEAEALAAAILAWRDPAGRPGRGPEGPKAAPFETVGELARVAGMTSGLLGRLEPNLTIASGLPHVDPALAPPLALAAALGIGEAAARDRVAGRRAAFLAGDRAPVEQNASAFLGRSTGTAFGITARVAVGRVSFVRRCVVVLGTAGRAPELIAWR